MDYQKILVSIYPPVLSFFKTFVDPARHTASFTRYQLVSNYHMILNLKCQRAPPRLVEVQHTTAPDGDLQQYLPPSPSLLLALTVAHIYYIPPTVAL